MLIVVRRHELSVNGKAGPNHRAGPVSVGARVSG